MITRDIKQGERVLLLLQEDYPAYHPLIGIAKIAHSTEDERLKFDCHKALSRFVEPELKSVEVSQAPPQAEILKVVFESADALALEHLDTSKLPVDQVLDGQFEDIEHKDELNVNVV